MQGTEGSTYTGLPVFIPNGRDESCSAWDDITTAGVHRRIALIFYTVAFLSYVIMSFLL